VSEAATDEQLRGLVGQLRAQVVELERIVREQADEIAELKRQVSADSSNSSRPPSSDAPWSKKPARKRSSQQVGAQARQAAGRVVVLAEPAR
jgi:transposase